MYIKGGFIINKVLILDILKWLCAFVKMNGKTKEQKNRAFTQLPLDYYFPTIKSKGVFLYTSGSRSESRFSLCVDVLCRRYGDEMPGNNHLNCVT